MKTEATETAATDPAQVRDRLHKWIDGINSPEGLAKLAQEAANIQKALKELAPTPPSLRERKTVSLTEAAEIFNVKRSTLLQALNRGRLEGIQADAKWKVEVEEIVRWIQEGNHQKGRPRKVDVAD